MNINADEAIELCEEYMLSIGKSKEWVDKQINGVRIWFDGSMYSDADWENGKGVNFQWTMFGLAIYYRLRKLVLEKLYEDDKPREKESVSAICSFLESEREELEKNVVELKEKIDELDRDNAAKRLSGLGTPTFEAKVAIAEAEQNALDAIKILEKEIPILENVIKEIPENPFGDENTADSANEESNETIYTTYADDEVLKNFG